LPFEAVEKTINCLNLEVVMERRVPGKHSYSGHILNEKLCLCAICGKIAKTAGIRKRSNTMDKPHVVCHNCLAEHHVANIQKKGAQELLQEREKVLLYVTLFQEIMSERYLKENGKSKFEDESEIKTFLEFIWSAWHDSGLELYQKTHSMSDNEIREAFRNLKVNCKHTED
jgi:hypothetical protein